MRVLGVDDDIKGNYLILYDKQLCKLYTKTFAMQYEDVLDVDGEIDEGQDSGPRSSSPLA